MPYKSLVNVNNYNNILLSAVFYTDLFKHNIKD